MLIKNIFNYKNYLAVFLLFGFFNSQASSHNFNYQTLKNNNMTDTLKIDFQLLKKDSWSNQEEKNVRLLIDFVQHLMNNHNFDYVKKNFSNNVYLQHNRSIPDGMDALVEYVKDFAKKYPDYTYDVRHIYADGDFVIFHSQATIKAKHRGNDKKGLNIIDTWRIVDGKIVEHWDALQPMDGSMRLFTWLTGGKIKNNNGVY
jgi:predicted SnoaL-like aldol condensation-catalyzing enzyme